MKQNVEKLVKHSKEASYYVQMFVVFLLMGLLYFIPSIVLITMNISKITEEFSSLVAFVVLLLVSAIFLSVAIVYRVKHSKLISDSNRWELFGATVVEASFNHFTGRISCRILIDYINYQKEDRTTYYRTTKYDIVSIRAGDKITIAKSRKVPRIVIVGMKPYNPIDQDIFSFSSQQNSGTF